MKWTPDHNKTLLYSIIFILQFKFFITGLIKLTTTFQPNLVIWAGIPNLLRLQSINQQDSSELINWG